MVFFIRHGTCANVCDKKIRYLGAIEVFRLSKKCYFEFHPLIGNQYGIGCHVPLSFSRCVVLALSSLIGTKQMHQSLFSQHLLRSIERYGRNSDLKEMRNFNFLWNAFDSLKSHRGVLELSNSHHVTCGHSN